MNNSLKFWRGPWLDDRHLIDEENEDNKRTWCIVTYSSNLRKLDSAIHIFHFSGPSIINLTAAFMLVIRKSRQKSNLRSNLNYKTILKKNIQQHKHLFTASVVLVILAVSRLIISLLLKCMNSTNHV
ncbi:unnamed protein product [Rotaria sordida]|uniref:Uncharacterized protein n=1 Tax=Rotaria sordida TaxID=392033 RepID=A0A819WR99_9BILA|nr:unnamed protein product [Rotaria sordida]